MTWSGYLTHFKEILFSENHTPQYDNKDYLHYTSLNWSRMNRWIKQQPLTQNTKAVIENIEVPQQWVIITEPWCGDAAHIAPIIFLMSELNKNITLEIQLRDSDSEIEKYLTNGKSRSIPIFIVRDNDGNDLFHWGPRPAKAAAMFTELTNANAPFEKIVTSLQQIYNKDNGLQIQEEICERIYSIKMR